MTYPTSPTYPTTPEAVAQSTVEGRPQYRWVYLWRWPLRVTHWISAACIVALAITGLYIGSPYMSTWREASGHFLMGKVRFAPSMCGCGVGIPRKSPSRLLVSDVMLLNSQRSDGKAARRNTDKPSSAVSVNEDKSGFATSVTVKANVRMGVLSTSGGSFWR